MYDQFEFLALPVIEDALATAKRLYGFEPRGATLDFLQAYRAVNGSPERLPREWQVIRAGAVRRRRDQCEWEDASRGDVFYNFGRPTFGHLAMIAFAYSDRPDAVVDWLEDEAACDAETASPGAVTPDEAG